VALSTAQQPTLSCCCWNPLECVLVLVLVLPPPAAVCFCCSLFVVALVYAHQTSPPARPPARAQ
jgi:hypothetical protein